MSDRLGFREITFGSWNFAIPETRDELRTPETGC